jgi:hypothetical protein
MHITLQDLDIQQEAAVHLEHLEIYNLLNEGF